VREIGGGVDPRVVLGLGRHHRPFHAPNVAHALRRGDRVTP